MLTKRLVALCAAMAMFMNMCALPALAWPNKLPGFDGYRFYKSDRNQSGGFTMVPDPLDPNNPNDVYKFSIVPKRCTPDDCKQQSVRSTVQQGPDANQPKEIWYGWDIYFPADFPKAGTQGRGFQIFNEWKDKDCKLVGLSVNHNRGGRDLLWEMEAPTGQPELQFGGDCVPILEISLGRMSNIVGSWHRFEFFARWSEGEDGRYVVYMDGEKKVDYSGITCFYCSKSNYYLFGNYLCCTESAKTIQPSTVYYRNLSRAARREDLVWQ
jgi:hypothetical protein